MVMSRKEEEGEEDEGWEKINSCCGWNPRGEKNPLLPLWCTHNNLPTFHFPSSFLPPYILILWNYARSSSQVSPKPVLWVPSRKVQEEDERRGYYGTAAAGYMRLYILVVHENKAWRAALYWNEVQHGAILTEREIPKRGRNRRISKQIKDPLNFPTPPSAFFLYL